MMKTQNFWNNPASFYSVFDDDDDDSNDLFEHFTAQILDAKYDSTTTQKVIDKQTHLNEYQKAESVGFAPWQIGTRVLRTETVPVVALTTLLALYSYDK